MIANSTTSASVDVNTGSDDADHDRGEAAGVAGHPAQQVALARAPMVGQRQRLQVLEHAPHPARAAGAPRRRPAGIPSPGAAPASPGTSPAPPPASHASMPAGVPAPGSAASHRRGRRQRVVPQHVVDDQLQRPGHERLQRDADDRQRAQRRDSPRARRGPAARSASSPRSRRILRVAPRRLSACSRAYVPAGREQLLVRAELDQAPGVEHGDAVRGADRRQPVRDDQRRPARRVSRASASITTRSDSASSAEVGSSRISTRGSFSSARAMAMRCR